MVPMSAGWLLRYLTRHCTSTLADSPLSQDPAGPLGPQTFQVAPCKSSRGRSLVINRSGLQVCSAGSRHHRTLALAETLCLHLLGMSFSPSDGNTSGSWSAGGGFGFRVGCADQAFGKSIKGGDSWAGRPGPGEPLGPALCVSDKRLKALSVYTRALS